MALKRVAKLNGYHSPTVGIKYKSRHSLEIWHWYLSSDAINFSYWHLKDYFFKGYIWPKNLTFFQVTTLCFIINHPVWAWNRNFKLIGRYKNAKTRFLTQKIYSKPIGTVQEQWTCMHLLSFEIMPPHCSSKHSSIQWQQWTFWSHCNIPQSLDWACRCSIVSVVLS